MKVNLKDKLELENNKLELNKEVPNFCLATLNERTIEDVYLSDFGKKIKIISCFPSIDTGICDLQTKRFNSTYANNEKVVVINVSCDLPFAFKKWCAANDASNFIMLSDYRDHSFAKSFGINVKHANLCYRSIFIVDENNKLIYSQYANAIPENLDYDEVDNFLKTILK